MEIRILTNDISSYDGKAQIKKGKLVIVEGHEISTLNRKTTIGCTDSEVKNYTKACKLTCKKDEILIMHFRSDYHDYYAIGKNPHEMYKKIIRMWNRNADSNYNTSNFHKQEYFNDYSAMVTKINIEDCIYWDDESDYRDSEELSMDRNVWLGNKKSNKITNCGNWFDLYRNNNPKCFPNKSMR